MFGLPHCRIAHRLLQLLFCALLLRAAFSQVAQEGTRGKATATELHKPFLLQRTQVKRSCSGEAAGVEEGTCGCAALHREALSDQSAVEKSAAAGGSAGSPLPEDMIAFPGGLFFIGTDDPLIAIDGESPRRSVILSPFSIDRYETSNIEFSAFVNATGYVTDSEKYGWSFVFYAAVSDAVYRTVTRSVGGAEWWVQVFGADWRHPEGPDRDVLLEGRGHHPVVQVSWNDANAYCKWRGARLPTEAEWEYAAAGGVVEFNGRYPWGNELTPNGKHRTNIWQGVFPRQNTGDDGFAFLSPVDAFGPQNEAGLYGMIGNAWEWVQDWWTVDHSSVTSGGGGDDLTQWDPTGPANGTDKVKKGGSFLCHQRWCYRYRIAARTHTEPDSATMNNGFRCAR